MTVNTHIGLYDLSVAMLHKWRGAALQDLVQLSVTEEHVRAIPHVLDNVVLLSGVATSSNWGVRLCAGLDGSEFLGNVTLQKSLVTGPEAVKLPNIVPLQPSDTGLVAMQKRLGYQVVLNASSPPDADAQSKLVTALLEGTIGTPGVALMAKKRLIKPDELRGTAGDSSLGDEDVQLWLDDRTEDLGKLGLTLKEWDTSHHERYSQLKAAIAVVAAAADDAMDAHEDSDG